MYQKNCRDETWTSLRAVIRVIEFTPWSAENMNLLYIRMVVWNPTHFECIFSKYNMYIGIVGIEMGIFSAS